ncbi:hypothetical protein HU200_063404 [Digitaria exilis]|uniref:Uncharacterized protein n=1 Tax=Digitaria exilis TaxID=1010633 RepID=A0A835A1Q0_9POAL|nr:hypothetical protein HU200_063404 [Digitaria exilis]
MIASRCFLLQHEPLSQAEQEFKELVSVHDRFVQMWSWMLACSLLRLEREDETFAQQSTAGAAGTGDIPWQHQWHWAKPYFRIPDVLLKSSLEKLSLLNE